MAEPPFAELEVVTARVAETPPIVTDETVRAELEPQAKQAMIIRSLSGIPNGAFENV